MSLRSNEREKQGGVFWILHVEPDIGGKSLGSNVTSLFMQTDLMEVANIGLHLGVLDTYVKE